MNSTMRKFGYPSNLIKEYNHWVVLLRNKQVTAGCMVLICKENGESLSQITQEAYSELPLITGDIEVALEKSFGVEKINYLALMMVDKNVHFHVIPRYSENKLFNNIIFTDKGWPKHPDMQYVHNISEKNFFELKKHIIDCWN